MTFQGRTIAFSEQEALAWGTLVAPFQLGGRRAALVDSMIATTALMHRLSVVTRNVQQFEPSGVPVINPWEGETGRDGLVSMLASDRLRPLA